ncbi:hypothetical protein XENOCAPTIV_021415 [Xenoophorus captivus]|uniref:Leucine-rich repeat flightless-interacting protein 2 n=1 Tax=Xenoophorus captivus TaxID=1517983 RepID=A0ABV0REV3_9TELE
MVSNAQLDNDKGNLIYQVDTLKDVIEEMEEQMAEMRRELDEKSKEFDKDLVALACLSAVVHYWTQSHAQFGILHVIMVKSANWLEACSDLPVTSHMVFRIFLQDELADIKGKSKAGEKHGLVIIPDGTPNGDVSHEPLPSGITLVTQEAAQVLESAGEGPLEKIEDELKAEKRKLQRELRTALDKIEEMEMTNSHLVKRLEKMKANRNAHLAQQ